MKIGYWKIRGLAEPIRILCHYLNVPFEDVLYEQGEGPEFSREDWYSKKFTLGLEFPNIPYLIDSDVKLTESFPIMRYLCGKYDPKLLGEGLLQQARIDMMSSVMYDFNMAKSMIVYTSDVASIPKAKFDLVNATIKKFAEILEKSKFLAGDNVTYLDFFWAEQLECINDLVDPIFKTYPSLYRYFKDVIALPNVHKYRTSEDYIKNPKPYNNKVARLGSKALPK
eukprot:TRINITY_DN322_c0_g2_i1.p1 TRINITY_DN322_c0_g2~~TRINITY_DN322_c0_g2_i1.p1  ORF type:complete len:264 (-),score=76.13 TRINITY_DN322_c0_g2_i1:53-727(-)